MSRRKFWVAIVLLASAVTTLMQLRMSVTYFTFHVVNLRPLIGPEFENKETKLNESIKDTPHHLKNVDDFIFFHKTQNEKERKENFMKNLPFALKRKKFTILKGNTPEKEIPEGSIEANKYDQDEDNLLVQEKSENQLRPKIVGSLIAKSIKSRSIIFKSQKYGLKLLPNQTLEADQNHSRVFAKTPTNKNSGEKTPGILSQHEWEFFVDPHSYPYLNNPREICYRDGNNTKTVLLLLVVSHPGSFRRREYIRKTWGSRSLLHFPNLTVTVFLLGGPPSDVIQNEIYKEAETCGDILQEDFQDTYLNLPIKSIMGLKWTSKFCPGAKFVMKVDDDIMLNVERMVAYLRKAPWRNFYGGKVADKFPVLRDVNTKFYMPFEIYGDDYYPPYCVGFAYVMSIDVVYKLYHQSLKTEVFPWEDVFMGILLRYYALLPKNIANFLGSAEFEENDKVKDSKSNIAKLRTLFTLHELNENQMKEVWTIWTGHFLQ